MNLNYTFFIGLACIALSVNTANCELNVVPDTDTLAARSSLSIQTNTVSSNYTKSGFRKDAGYVTVELKPADSLPVAPAASNVVKSADATLATSPKYTKSGFRNDADCVFVGTNNTQDSLYHAEKTALQEPKRTWFQYIGNKSSESWTSVCVNTTKAFKSVIAVASKLSANVSAYIATTSWF
jgi:hypothetical protein